jgi:hypothetical protein
MTFPATSSNFGRPVDSAVRILAAPNERIRRKIRRLHRVEGKGVQVEVLPAFNPGSTMVYRWVSEHVAPPEGPGPAGRDEACGAPWR